MTDRQTAHLHDTKLDALEELVEELCGQPILVAYEFNHDLERLQKRFPGAPYIGSGVNSNKLQEIVDAWNAGEITVLLAHPASAGHGLNLQGSGAAHIAWFGPIWDLELYEQFIQRVYRQGTTATRVVNHIIVAKNTIDELVMTALRDKSVTQDKLLSSLCAEILRDAETPAAGDAVTKERVMEVRKLSRQSDAQEPTTTGTRIVPKGWGKPPAAEHNVTELPSEEAPRATLGRRPAAEEIEQRAAITRKITNAPEDREPEPEQPPPSARARGMFSPGIQDKLRAAEKELPAALQERDSEMDQPHHGHADAREESAKAEAGTSPEKTRTPRPKSAAISPELRLKALELAFSTAPPGTDVFTNAKAITAFLTETG